MQKGCLVVAPTATNISEVSLPIDSNDTTTTSAQQQQQHKETKNNRKITNNNMKEASYKLIFLKCLAGGIGDATSGFLTNPMDVIKTKNQQYGTKQIKFAGITTTARVLWQEEGYRGFFKGAGTAVVRGLTYSGVRMGLYEPIKDLMITLTGKSPDSPTVKFTSSFFSGAIGAAIFNPIDLIKVRFQSQLPGHPKPYPSILQGFISIYKTENGFRGLYNGTAPAVVRSAFLTCAQLGSYDIIKNNILVQRLNFDHDSVYTHFSAALLASIVATTAANPPDVIKTRVMNDKIFQQKQNLVGNSTTAKSTTKAVEGDIAKATRHVKDILKKEGPSAFFKGWTASYLRLGPDTIISFLIIEQVRKLFGMTTY